jgi:hypothetical protein
LKFSDDSPSPKDEYGESKKNVRSHSHKRSRTTKNQLFHSGGVMHIENAAFLGMVRSDSDDLEVIRVAKEPKRSYFDEIS